MATAGVHIGKVLVDTTSNPKEQDQQHCLGPKELQQAKRGKALTVPPLSLEPSLRFRRAPTIPGSLHMCTCVRHHANFTCNRPSAGVLHLHTFCLKQLELAPAQASALPKAGGRPAS